jgi:predicted MFS family arabinose efflux permease
MRRLWVQVVVATVVLTAVQAGLSFLVPATEDTPEGLAAFLVSNLLVAGLLTFINARLRARGVARAGVLWVVWGGIQANSLLEAVLFDIGIPLGDLAWLAAFSLAVSGCFALFLALAFRSHDAPNEPATRGTLSWWRLAVCIVAYIVLYFTAGTVAYPYLRDFYEARPMPAQSTVALLQVFRGLVFCGIVTVIVRQVRASRLGAAVLAALALSVLGGIAPLIVPNPYLPDPIRYAHLPEVGVSNFLFGLLAGWLLSAPRREPAVSERAATASVLP